MSLTENYYVLKSNIDALESEIKQLQNGRKASASRSRKCLQNIKKQSFNMRKSITTHVKGLPIKKRTKAEEKVVSEVSDTKPVEPPSDLTKSDTIAVETDSTAKVEPEKPVKQRKTRLTMLNILLLYVMVPY